jgi:uncharacterized protein (TIGR00255 family)
MSMTEPKLASMTGFARAAGTLEGLAWAWELRSVNGRGLEVRLRLPAGYDALEPALREAATKVLKRGNVSGTLTVKREESPRLAPDPAALEQALSLALSLATRIPGAPPPRAEALLALPGVLRPAAATAEEADPAPALAALREGFLAALDGLVVARREEGTRLGAMLAAQLAEIATLRARAAEQAADQPAAHRARMLETLRDLLGESGRDLPEERIAQEVALLAARSDVREELDRLDSHIVAARALLAEGVAVGRRLDFLVQEFNREANTLCSKSASVTLTATGLALKSAIEQLREQVQNIE